MLKTVATALVVLIGGVLIFVLTRPDSFRVERSITIQRTPDQIFPLIDNFHQWESWSPWENIDPQIQRIYSGAAQGQGAIYEWRGNKDIGQGRMAITEAVPSSRVSIKLDFVTPFEAHNTVDFLLQPQGQATKVTQAMYGPSPFVAKLMGLFFSMDKMVGGKYEEGLAKLKALAER
jgi:hypothetical protein